MIKKIFFKILKSAIIGVAAIFLVAVSLDAADHRGNLSESIAGRLIFGDNKALCPEDMVFVQADWGDYCIDKYENSPSNDCPNKSPESIQQSHDNISFKGCLPVSKPDMLPWTSISQDQAAYICAKAEKRLPANREWSQAAIGTPDSDSDWGADDCQVANNWKIQPGLTGSGLNCVSFAGAYDMIGNVWEWVAGTVSDGFYDGIALPEAGYVHGIDKAGAFPADTEEIPQEEYYGDYLWIKTNGTRAISRGGYWDNKSEAGQYAHYIVSPPTFSGKGVGFRCVKNISK